MKEIIIKKNCNNCKHRNICKYLAEAEKVSNTKPLSEISDILNLFKSGASSFRCYSPMLNRYERIDVNKLDSNLRNLIMKEHLREDIYKGSYGFVSNDFRFTFREDGILGKKDSVIDSEDFNNSATLNFV